MAAPAYLGLGLAAGGGVPYAVMSALIGAGLGVQIAVTTMVTEQVDRAYAADASGALLTVMQLGQVIGVSTVGTLFMALESASVAAALPTAAAMAGLAALAGLSAILLVRRRTLALA